MRGETFMKKFLSMLMAAVMLVTSFAFSASAVTKTEAEEAVNAAFDNMFNGVAGDVNGDNQLTAKDARDALVYSAGLDDSGIDASKADIDGDGVVTAIDARTILRVSAQLEEKDVLYSGADKFELFNALINSIKPLKQEFQKTTVNTVVNITYDNHEGIKKFNNQMNRLAGSSGEKMDFGAALTEDIGKKSYSSITNIKPASSTNFPISGEADISSLLTMNDISGIEYKTDQTYTFNVYNYNDTLNTDLSVTMNNLDSVTAYIKQETVSDIPENIQTLSHGKCFDIPDKDTFMAGYKEINNMFTGDIADLVGTIKADFNQLKYYDSYVTIYFDHDTKKICAVEYNLQYDFTVGIRMDLESPLELILNIHETINVTDTENTKYCYFFKNNYKTIS